MLEAGEWTFLWLKHVFLQKELWEGIVLTLKFHPNKGQEHPYLQVLFKTWKETDVLLPFKILHYHLLYNNESYIISDPYWSYVVHITLRVKKRGLK